MKTDRFIGLEYQGMYRLALLEELKREQPQLRHKIEGVATDAHNSEREAAWTVISGAACGLTAMLLKADTTAVTLSALIGGPYVGKRFYLKDMYKRMDENFGKLEKQLEPSEFVDMWKEGCTRKNLKRLGLIRYENPLLTILPSPLTGAGRRFLERYPEMEPNTREMHESELTTATRELARSAYDLVRIAADAGWDIAKESLSDWYKRSTKLEKLLAGTALVGITAAGFTIPVKNYLDPCHNKPAVVCQYATAEHVFNEAKKERADLEAKTSGTKENIFQAKFLDDSIAEEEAVLRALAQTPEVMAHSQESASLQPVLRYVEPLTRSGTLTTENAAAASLNFGGRGLALLSMYGLLLADKRRKKKTAKANRK